MDRKPTAAKNEIQKRMKRAREQAELFCTLYMDDEPGSAVEHLAIMLDNAWLGGWLAGFEEAPLSLAIMLDNAWLDGWLAGFEDGK